MASKEHLALLLLLTSSTAFALAAGEIGTRVLVEHAPSSTIMYSSPHWQLDDRGAVRHIPKETVRLVSVFDEAIEFDVTFQTNNLGLVDHRDYPATPRHRSQYAFVGDSFTHGMGAEPWVPKLRDALQSGAHDLEIYNLGVNGASVQHFRKLLASIAAEVPISHIVIITISNDFLRPWWVPIETADGGLMCRDPPACTIARPLAPVISRDASSARLLEIHRSLRVAAAARGEAALAREPLWKRLLWRSELYLMARRTVRGAAERFEAAPTPVVPPAEFAGLEHPGFLPANLEAFAGIRTDFPTLPITLAHFPQVNELRAGRYEVELSRAAADARIDYFPALMRCDWSAAMYHRVNAHPNEAGYANFAACLSRHVLGRELEPATLDRAADQ